MFHFVLKNEHFQLAAILESNTFPYSAVEKPSEYPTVNVQTFVLIFAFSLWAVHVSLETKSGASHTLLLEENYPPKRSRHTACIPQPFTQVTDHYIPHGPEYSSPSFIQNAFSHRVTYYLPQTQDSIS